MPVCLLAGIAACKKNAQSPIPEIRFIELTPDSVRAGSITDTAFLHFGFKDGDGDLGRDPSRGEYDVFIRDSRFANDTSVPVARYFFPPIPDDARDPVNGLEGFGKIALRAVFIQPRQDTLHRLHGDTLVYHMWVMDRAGNYSDTIETTPLYIRP